MATALVLPEIAAKGLVPAHDLSLVRQLRSSWNVRLKTSWEGSNSRYLSSLEIETGCSVEQLQGALNELEEANARRATPTQIAKGLAVLTAVCAKPADFDDAKVVLWSERLKMVLQEYPDAVAMAAVSSWPQSENGKWWPTENEIHAACKLANGLRNLLEIELLKAIDIRRYDVERQAREPQSPDGFDDEPQGAALAYVNAIFLRNPLRAAAYLTGARFKDDRIGVRYPLAAIALEDTAPGLLAEHGVRIVAPRAFTAHGDVEWAE